MKSIFNFLTRLQFLLVFICVYVHGTDFKLGIENASMLFKSPFQQSITTCKIGFITNHTGKDQKGNRSVDLLLREGLNIVYLLAPEHGFNGTVAAGKEVSDAIDQKSGIKIASLYGHSTNREISTHVMSDVDILMFDMQDVGMRHYTYIATMLYAMQSAAKYKKPFVVFDRPNPLGHRIEGPIVDKVIPGSMIAAAPIPLRHGMTVGELAQFFNTYMLHNAVQLYVVKMQGYKRVNTPHAVLENLSPNIKSAQSCYGYSFLGLLGEVRPFDVGVGTDTPFCRIGLPQRHSIAREVWSSLQTLLSVQGIQARIEDYTRRKQPFRGITFSINNIEKVASFELLLRVLLLFKQAGISLQFSEYFDRAVGTQQVRNYIEGSISRVALAQVINTRMKKFLIQARTAYLYAPIPHYVEMD